MDQPGPGVVSNTALEVLSRPVRAWFLERFPEGPTPAQELAWPPIAAGEHTLLISPTGTGKTLAAFLAVLDRLFRAVETGTLAAGLRCVYISPLRSLNYDIERNLSVPLEGIARRQNGGESADSRRRAHRRHLGERAPQAAGSSAARADHHTREPFAALESDKLAGALAWRRAHRCRRGSRAGADQAWG